MSNFEISAGATQAVIAIARDADGQPVEVTDPSWTESAAAFSVTPGAGMAATVTAVAPGSGTLRVSATSVSEPTYAIAGTSTITVRDVATFTFSEDPLLMDPGDERTLTATPRDSAGATHASLTLTAVSWHVEKTATVDDLDIVTISPATGSLAPTVTAVRPGSATIRVNGTRGTDHRQVSSTLPVRVSGATSLGIEAAS